MRHSLLSILLSAVVLGGCFESTEGSSPDGVTAINPRTGEMRHFASVEDVPEGWETCPDGMCPAPLACGELDEPSCLARTDCTPVYAEGHPDDADPYVSCVESGDATCDPAACGPELGAPTFICPDGSVGGSTGRCIALTDGGCGWEVLDCETPCDCGPAPGADPMCPDGASGAWSCEHRADGTCGWSHSCGTTVDCSEAECDPAPGAPSMICPDGTVAGPMCVRDPAGICGWIFTECAGPACASDTDCAEGSVCEAGVCVASCPDAECGPAPGIPAWTCDDGSPAGFTGRCLRHADGMCGWEILECPSPPPDPCDPSTGMTCPAPACDPMACGPVPGGAHPSCGDGTVASLECLPSPDGVCGWQFVCGGSSGGGTPGSGG